MTFHLISLQKKTEKKMQLSRIVYYTHPSTPMKKSLKKSNIVLENINSHQYGETGYYLIAIFGKGEIMLDFIKKLRNL